MGQRMDQTEPFLDSQQVRTWLNCSLRSLYRYIHKDGFPAYRLGHAYKFKRSEIERWMHERRNGKFRRITKVVPHDD